MGLGLRVEHYRDFELNPLRDLAFLEIISENFMDTKGRPFYLLQQLAELYPIHMHGVSLSIGSHLEIDFEYLKKIKLLKKSCGAKLVSDHLCFAQSASHHSHALLPILYTEENLKRLSCKVNQVQDFLECSLSLENLSAYFELKKSSMSEAQFLQALCRETSCGLLLDLNNIFINGQNLNFDPHDYLREIDLNSVRAIHVAGHLKQAQFLFDNHGSSVCEAVIALLKSVIDRQPHIPITLERDENIPNLQDLMDELKSIEKKLSHAKESLSNE